MGQAKIRGTLEKRYLQAKEKINAIRPKQIICNRCKSEIYEIKDLSIKGLVGIQGVFVGSCIECKTSTFAIKGEPNAVTNLMLNLEESFGGEGLMGAQTISGQAIE